MKELNRMMFSWGRLYSLLTKAPLTSILLPLFGAILLQLLAVDISGWGALGSSVARRPQTGGWPFVTDVIKTAAAILLYVYMLFSAVVVGFGFRCKRAIFAGGETVPDLFFRLFETDVLERWKQIPSANFYHTENRVFETLQVSKTPRVSPGSRSNLPTNHFRLGRVGVEGWTFLPTMFC